MTNNRFPGVDLKLNFEDLYMLYCSMQLASCTAKCVGNRLAEKRFEELMKVIEPLMPQEMKEFGEEESYELLVRIKDAKKIELSRKPNYQGRLQITIDGNKVFSTQKYNYEQGAEDLLNMVEFFKSVAPIDAEVIEMKSLRHYLWQGEEDCPDLTLNTLPTMSP